MEDDAQGVPASAANTADAMPHINAIDTACTLHRSLVHSKNYRIALTQRNDLWPGLHARPLLGKNEFTTGEITVGRRQQNCHLQRKNMLAIQVLMQAVVIANAVLQE